MKHFPYSEKVNNFNQICFGSFAADLAKTAAKLDNDPTALVSKNMHLKTDAQQATAGKAIQAIYGSFKANPYKAVKVVLPSWSRKNTNSL